MEYLKRIFNFNIQKVALDSGYATLDIKKYIIDNNIFGVIGYRRFGSQESRQEKNKYYYNKEYDVYVDKETGEVLEYSGKIDRLGYKTYINLDKDKIVRRHICEWMNERIREYRISKEGKELYKKRKEKVERSFADSKQNHGYRYAMHKGLIKNQHYTWLICAAQNMKTISMKIENRQYEEYKTNDIRQILIKFIKKLRKFFQTKTSVIKNWGLSTIWKITLIA